MANMSQTYVISTLGNFQVAFSIITMEEKVTLIIKLEKKKLYVNAIEKVFITDLENIYRPN